MKRVALSLAALAAVAGSPAAVEPPDPLVTRGFRETEGAAAGYVSDQACALCHRQLFDSYQAVGMARSFFAPRRDRDIEDLGRTFVHQPSRERYRISRGRDDRLRFRRERLDERGRPTHAFEVDVDWILGSGHHARTYLYQTPGGELYQLPVAWYSQSRTWGMAPGFDRPDHDGVGRRIRRECMFCHNAFPEVAAESDRYGAPQTYPAELPQGTGCQRCHGPGARHARLALSLSPGAEGDAAEALRAAIVNPARLPPPERDGVCFQCHLQPSVALPGLVRFGRGDYSFRPGETLSDFRLAFEVRQEPADRFEINHHAYRLLQSRCYTESAGRLGCITCHDPHTRVAEAERAAHFRAACLSCHQAEDCGQTGGHGGDEGFLPAARAENCAACHMPRRRTDDVVHVVMTDHHIQRRPGGPELLAPRLERDPVLTGLEFLDRAAPAGPVGEVYRASGLLRVARSPAAVDHLEAQLRLAGLSDVEPWLDLAEGQLTRHRFEEAERTLRDLLRRRPDLLLAEEWLAIALAGAGRTDEAIAALRATLERQGDRPEAQFNLGRLLTGTGRHAESLVPFGRALALRPNLVAAWLHQGRAQRALGRTREAAASFRRALEIEPRNAQAAAEAARPVQLQGVGSTRSQGGP